jgi:formate/nitrite transporter
MSYLQPAEFAIKMVDAGEAKVRMGLRDTLIRSYMAGALLALAVVFAVSINVQTGNPLVGAAFFPVGFAMIYLMGFDLLTGVFVIAPLAWLDRRPGITIGRVLACWGKVFVGNYLGALSIAYMMYVNFTFGFSSPVNPVGNVIAKIGATRTVGYKIHGTGGWFTLFERGALCNWMVTTGVVGALIATSVSGKVIAMWMPIMVFFYLGFEHSVVNMFLFPLALMCHGDFGIRDYILWNEFPTVLGNIVGGLTLTGLMLYITHVRTQPQREFEPILNGHHASSESDRPMKLPVGSDR